MAGPVVLDEYPLNQEELNKKIAHMDQDLATIKDSYYEEINDNYSVRFLVGAAVFLKMSLMKKIGFYDKKIFLYYEDDELCGRVRTNGFQNILVPNAVAFHISGGGKSSGSSLRITYKKSWHLIWSKLYWKKLRQGESRARIAALRFSVVYFFKTLFSFFSFNSKRIIANSGTMVGAFAFLIGLKSFDKNGNPRGNLKI
jgi:GT2 family glycosyltransferase